MGDINDELRENENSLQWASGTKRNESKRERERERWKAFENGSTVATAKKSPKRRQHNRFKPIISSQSHKLPIFLLHRFASKSKCVTILHLVSSLITLFKTKKKCSMHTMSLKCLANWCPASENKFIGCIVASTTHTQITLCKMWLHCCNCK